SACTRPPGRPSEVPLEEVRSSDVAPGYHSHVPFDWKTRRKFLDLPFPQSEYDSRLGRVRKAMAEAGVGALLVFGDQGDSGDLVYLSNFIPFGRAAMVLPLAGSPQIITDAVLHGEPINSYAWMTWIQEFTAVHHSPAEFAQAISRSLRMQGVKKVGLVGLDNIPLPVWRKLEGEIPSWVDFSWELLKIKSVRSPREVALLREVGRVTAAGMKAAVESVRVGVTESELVGVASKVLFEQGAHDRAFSTIVNSGPRSGVKHSYPTKRKIARGDMVYLDMGATEYGYLSDMSRTVVVGGANETQLEVLDVVEEAFETLLSMMRPGVRTSRLMAKAEEIAGRSGLRKKYAGRIYLGLAVHHAIATSFFEIPSIGLPDTVLKKSMSFAFEPMAHILDFGTAVIEDCILITGSGAESLTPYERVHW
ncbi:MAG: Xaa-Pro peptidase family protein, partial [Thaumarchaeota archaeon]|nr:Xaa-Pro peptidase family protein [Nitrososphaerota archaeon]